MQRGRPPATAKTGGPLPARFPFYGGEGNVMGAVTTQDKVMERKEGPKRKVVMFEARPEGFLGQTRRGIPGRAKATR